MSEGLEICRVCFQKTDWQDTQEINISKLREIVKITQLTSLECPSLSSYEGHQICNSCITNFRSFKILNNLVRESNSKVESLMSNNGNTLINLEQLVPNMQNVQICRVCLKPAASVASYLYETPSNLVPFDFITKMLDDCNLELVYLKNTSRPVLCHICWQRIQVVYAFQKHCSTVSSRVVFYCKLLVKFNLDQNDLDDIVHMWDHLVPNSDDASDTEITLPSVYLEEHNYSKQFFDSDEDSDTLSATSSLDREICETSNLFDLISPPSPPEIVDYPEYYPLKSTPEQYFNFSDSENDLPLLDRVALNQTDCTTSNIVINSSIPENVSVLRKKRGRPPGTTNKRNKRIEKNLLEIKEEEGHKDFISDATDLNFPPPFKHPIKIEERRFDLKIFGNRVRQRSKKKSPTKKHTIELMDQIRSESLLKRTVEKDHNSPISETQDTGDCEGPPDLEWQGICGYNPIIPTIQNTFSLAYDETQKRLEVEFVKSSETEETVEFRIEPFSDNEDPLQLPTNSDIKEAYVALEKCDLTIIDEDFMCKKKPEWESKDVNQTEHFTLNGGEETLSKMLTDPSDKLLIELFDKDASALNVLVEEKSPTVKVTEIPEDVFNLAETTQNPENHCDMCDYQGIDSLNLKLHKLLCHWTKDSKLDCSQCLRRKIGANIICLKCDRQFHSACMVAHQLFDTDNHCTHLAAKRCIVLTKNFLVASDTENPFQIYRPKICECCDKPLTNYLGCEICGTYSHYKCAYDKAISNEPICMHIPAFFRKMATMFPRDEAKCDHCKKVITHPIPCPKCLTFMHPNCFVENFTPNCDHRDVLCSYRPTKRRKATATDAKLIQSPAVNRQILSKT